MENNNDLDFIQKFKFDDFFKNLNTRWHQEFNATIKNPEEFNDLIFNLHFYNYSLWHEEDEARREDVSDTVIANTKRNIDKFNQKRNDSIEMVDTYLLNRLKNCSTYKDGLQINSETPGSIVDRLSIISLKIYHMREQTERDDVDEDHRVKCMDKVKVLLQQQKDLLNCFQILLEDCSAGKKSIKVYFQFKMYNDPNLNPALYKQ